MQVTIPLEDGIQRMWFARNEDAQSLAGSEARQPFEHAFERLRRFEAADIDLDVVLLVVVWLVHAVASISRMALMISS